MIRRRIACANKVLMKATEQQNAAIKSLSNEVKLLLEKDKNKQKNVGKFNGLAKNSSLS